VPEAAKTAVGLRWEGGGVDVFTSVKLPLGPLGVISSFILKISWLILAVQKRESSYN
jgi:hypothetical protein